MKTNATLRSRGESRRSKPVRRRGMAVLLVLGLLAITLAVSYAALRTQGTTNSMARNSGRALDARLAAESGLAAAMHQISDNSWQGVDVGLTGDVSDDSWYEVSFTTGDAELLPGDPNYAEFPYRLTITSTGYAEDPANPDVRAIHRVRSVVQLARKRLVADPANWNSLTSYTVYQWGNRATQIQEPVRINGPAHILGTLYLSAEYPSYAAARTRYLQDLNAMRLAGRGDHRPFSGPLTIAYSRNAANLTPLQTWLGLTTTDTTAATTAPLTFPGDVASYRLYPGGKTYEPPVLQDSYGGTLQNVTLGADPVTNPLGVFRCRGALAIQNNVNIKGIVVADSTTPDIQIYGTNVVLQAANLPRLEGSNQNYQLPILIVKEDVRIHGGSESKITGLSVLWDEFELKRGAPTTQLALTGSLLASGINLKGRDTWLMTVTDWTNDYNNFNGTGSLLAALLADLLNTIRAALGLPPGATVHFAEYMQHVRGFTIQPALTLQPDSSGVLSHWQDWTQPIYLPDSSDPGLRWNLIRYEDGV
jgi:hypothetical protein